MCLLFLEAVLGDHDIFERPVLQFGNAIQTSLFGDVLSGLFSAHRHFLGEPAHQLHYLGQVVVVFAEMLIGVFLGVEEQFSGEEFKGHAGERPHVC